MSNGISTRQSADVACPRLQHLRVLLSDALKLVDELELPPATGARLQEVIDSVGGTSEPAGNFDSE
jgi:hypothetical protein